MLINQIFFNLILAVINSIDFLYYFTYTFPLRTATIHVK